MQAQIYQDKDPAQRETMLSDTCDKVDNFKFEKSFTNQDIEQFCERLSEIMIEVRKSEGELSAIKKEFTEKMKPLKVELTELLDSIKFRSKMVEEKVYIFIDYEKNQVGYYTKEGMLVHKRLLRIDEHQRSIMSATRNRKDYMGDEEDEVEVDAEVVEGDDK